ncbi:MAG: acylphosphatase [Planctomycetota bacterium]
MDTRRVRAIVSGRVQGVAYRFSAEDEADRLGLAGWVRNLPDGRVEVVAEGPPEKVEAFVEWCRRGPPLARVTSVEVEDLEPAGELRGFTIRR